MISLEYGSIETQNLLNIDELQAYYGYDYYVNDKIKITTPMVDDIVKFGDSKFFSMVSTLCANPTSFRLQLWDMGIDWNKISDFELFRYLIKSYTPKDTYLLFGDLNFSWFEEFHNNEADCDLLLYIPRDENGNIPIDNEGKVVLPNLEDAIVIYELDYIKIAQYLRWMFNIHPKVEHAKGRATKEAIIDEERWNIEAEKKKKKDNDVSKSFLLPLISSMVNHPGFKYKRTELNEVNIVEFMDSVRRLQTFESTTALMKGIYSGMVDTSKIKNLDQELNWMRDLNK